jgi:hypothetical protein
MGRDAKYTKLGYSLEEHPGRLEAEHMEALSDIRAQLVNDTQDRAAVAIQESLQEQMGAKESFQSTFNLKALEDGTEMHQVVKIIKKANVQREQKIFGIRPDDDRRFNRS